MSNYTRCCFVVGVWLGQTFGVVCCLIICTDIRSDLGLPVPHSAALAELQCPLHRDLRLVPAPYNINGPAGDIGLTLSLADEVTDADHRKGCGCYWCSRAAYLVYFIQPCQPLEGPTAQAPLVRFPPRPASVSSSSSSPYPTLAPVLPAGSARYIR